MGRRREGMILSTVKKKGRKGEKEEKTKRTKNRGMAGQKREMESIKI